jgi:hypothetical protein
MQASNIVITLENVSEVEAIELVAFYNSRNPEAKVTRFRDRKTAEKRVMAILEAEKEQENNRSFAFESSEEVETETAVNPNPAAYIFPKAIDFIDAVTPKVPAVMENAEKWVIDAKPPVDIFSLVKVDNVETDPVYRVYYRTEVDGIEEDIIIYAGISREEADQEYKDASLHYPTNNAFKLFLDKEKENIWSDSFEASEVVEESEEEAKARIEAEAAAEATAGSDSGTVKDKAEKRQAYARASNSLGVALSWQDKEVRAARLTRDGVTVTVDGVTTAHQSTRAAFREYRLPDSVHIRFRLKLKASRDEVFNFNGVDYRFKMVEIEI